MALSKQKEELFESCLVANPRPYSRSFLPALLYHSTLQHTQPPGLDRRFSNPAPGSNEATLVQKETLNSENDIAGSAWTKTDKLQTETYVDR